MKTVLTLALALTVVSAFADKGCSSCNGCGSAVFKAKAFNKKDAEFLALANHMAMNADAKKGMSCCASGKAHGKGHAKAAKAKHAH